MAVGVDMAPERFGTSYAAKGPTSRTFRNLDDLTVQFDGWRTGAAKVQSVLTGRRLL